MDDAYVRPISEIAEIVRDRRTALRLSQRRAATLADVSSTTWQSFEKHHHPVSEMTLTGMAAALRWPSNWFDRLQAGDDPGELAEQPNGNSPNGHPSDAGSWDDLKSDLSEADRAAVRAIIDQLRAKHH